MQEGKRCGRAPSVGSECAEHLPPHLRPGPLQVLSLATWLASPPSLKPAGKVTGCGAAEGRGPSSGGEGSSDSSAPLGAGLVQLSSAHRGIGVFANPLRGEAGKVPLGTRGRLLLLAAPGWGSLLHRESDCNDLERCCKQEHPRSAAVVVCCSWQSQELGLCFSLCCLLLSLLFASP